MLIDFGENDGGAAARLRTDDDGGARIMPVADGG